MNSDSADSGCRQALVWMGSFFLVVGMLIILALASWGRSRIPEARIVEVRAQIEKSRPNLGQQQGIILKLAVAAEGWPGIAHYCARNLTFEDLVARGEASHMLRNFHSLLWTVVLKTRFSNEELLIYWSSITPHGGARGLWNGAMEHHKKPLQALDTRELAALVAMVRRPASFKPGTPRSEERIDRILEAADLSDSP